MLSNQRSQVKTEKKHMAQFETLKRDGGKDELGNIIAGVPKDFSLPIKSRKEVLAEKIQKTANDLMAAEIDLAYFQHGKLAGDKQVEVLIPQAEATKRMKAKFLEWLSTQYASSK